MQYTIMDILSDEEFTEAVLLSGESVSSSLFVSSVSVIEMPVENFVRENELVLTTAMGLGTSTDYFLSFVKEIHKSGATALAVAVGYHVQRIPEEVIRYAKKCEFPIIQLPWEVRFSDIIKKIYSQITFWQEAAIKKNDQLHKEILQLFLANDPLTSALQLLAEHLQANVLFCYGSDTAQATFSSSKLAFHDIDLYLKGKYPPEPEIIHVSNNRKLQLFPIRTLQNDNGLLVIELTKTDALKPWTDIHQFATMLQLWFQKQQTLLANKNKEKEYFIQLLINGEWETNESLMDKAASLSYDVTVPYLCIVGKPEFDVDPYFYRPSDFPSLAAKLDEITHLVSKNLHRKTIHYFTRNKFILFIEVDHDVCCIANKALDIFDIYVKNKELPLFSWGIGENNAGLYCFHEGYRDSITALEIGKNFKGIGQRSTYANTGIFRVLSVLRDSKEATEMMHTVIGKVATYDREKGLDLLHTLAVYLKNHCNVSQTSRELSLHRQSLLYRLKKIETLTGQSLSDADDVFLLHLCLQLWTIRCHSNDYT